MLDPALLEAGHPMLAPRIKSPADVAWEEGKLDGKNHPGEVWKNCGDLYPPSYYNGGLCPPSFFSGELKKIEMRNRSWRKYWQEYEVRGCYATYPNGSYICNHNAADPVCKGKDGKGCLLNDLGLLYPLPEVMDAKLWFYCPASRKCVTSWDECLGDNADVTRAQSKPEVHTVIPFGQGNSTFRDIPMTIKIVFLSELSLTDAGAGYQPLTGQLLGGLRNFGGTLVRVWTSRNLFAAKFPPNRCTRVLTPVVDMSHALHLAVVLMCGDGEVSVRLPPGFVHEGPHFNAMLSLSYLRYAPREVQGLRPLCDQLQNDWSCLKTQDPKASEAYYHVLSFSGSKQLCLLSGTIHHKKFHSDSSMVAKLGPECGAGLPSGYRVAANIKVNGTQEWAMSGPPPFQLVLKGSELFLENTAAPSRGQRVSLSLDGLVIPSMSASAGEVGEAATHRLLSEKRPDLSELKKKCMDTVAAIRLQEDNEALLHQTVGSQTTVASQPTATAQPTMGAAKSVRVNVTRLISDQISSEIVGTFVRNSIIDSSHQAVFGNDITTRYCALHGVAKFTSIPSTSSGSRTVSCVAFLDPNFRDPDTAIPYCFPMDARIFFAGVVKSEFSAIERLVPVQLEPHGRLVVLGQEPDDLLIRLDNIAFQPLTRAHTVPTSCAPYCFPTGLLGHRKLGVAGCTKYCVPPQQIQQPNFSKEPSPCKCSVLKRLACFVHDGSETTTCGQFKIQLSMRATPKQTNDESCDQICAGQVAAF